MAQIHNYNFPTSIAYGAGAKNLIPDVFKQNKALKPLIVTDKGVVELNWFNPLVADLKKAGLNPAVFSGIWGNPVKSQVQAGVNAYREAGSDSILAVGGGAAIDVAKAIALMIHHPGDLFDYEDEKPGALPVNQPIPYIAAVPTTAGTGSEVGRSSVVSDDVTKIKKIIFSPRLLAQKVFADPELTLGLPASITAATGMDALTHLVEAFLAKGFHPICEGIALEGIRLVSQSLMDCVGYAKSKEGPTPKHIESRGLMLNASMMGAVAFQKGLGVTHSCAHALSTVFDLHHGLANGIMIDYAMKFNREVVPQKFERMAHAAGQKDFIAWLEALKKQVGVPASLTELGIKSKLTPEKWNQLIQCAVNDACHPSNPRPVTQKDFENIFNQALS